MAVDTFLSEDKVALVCLVFIGDFDMWFIELFLRCGLGFLNRQKRSSWSALLTSDVKADLHFEHENKTAELLTPFLTSAGGLGPSLVN